MSTTQRHDVALQNQTNRETGTRSEHVGSTISGDEVVPADSPEGRAAMPQLKPKGMIVLMVSVLAMILIASIVVAAIWSLPAGALVLVFGTGLAFLGNPAIWATTMRTQERRDGVTN